MKLSTRHPLDLSPRSGLVLVLVLVVVMMLSFAVYSFSSLMLAEYEATTTSLTHFQRRELAASGIELAAAAIQSHGTGPSDGEIRLRQPVLITLPSGQEASIALLKELPPPGQAPVFGLRDESAKLNLNTLPVELSRRKESRRRLMIIPGMTMQIADALLDWMDPDDKPSEFGAETSYYTAQSPPRKPRQGPFLELNELLLVRGITPSLLFGEDQNRNNILDPEENDGDQSWPPDNADGFLQRGLSEYLTLLSCEGTVLPNGRRRINLNQPTLAVLYDQLEPVLGTEAAIWIVAFRMQGATYPDDLRPDEGDDLERRRLERLESVAKRLEAQLGNIDGRRPALSADQTQRGGLTLSDGPMLFKSLLEIFGGQIRIMVEGKDTLLQSPWAADPGTIRRMLPLLEQVLTTTDRDVLSGRININEASEPVLRTVPELSDSAARAIVRMQAEIRNARNPEAFSSVAWPLSRGLVSAAQLRAMGPYITTHGDVRSGISVGQTANHQSAAAIAFLLDCSAPDHRLLEMHDLPVMSRKALRLP